MHTFQSCENKNPCTAGIVYVASGLRHFEEAIKAAGSVRACMPSTPITIFSDQVHAASCDMIYFELLREEEKLKSFAAKILPLLRTPYERTLYLDTDTYMCGSCLELFDLLDRCDLAVAHDPWRCEYEYERLPVCFPTLNTGVIVFRKAPAVAQFIRDWHANYSRLFSRLPPIDGNDQPSFRHSLFHSDLRFLILPTEYNLRTYYPCFIGGYSKVKIIHDRHPHLQKTAKMLNKFERPRIYGTLSPTLVFYYYYQKAFKVALRLIRKLLPRSTV